MQLDLFDDSLSSAMRQALIAALQHRDRSAGRKTLAILSTRYPDDDLVPPAQELLLALSWKTPSFAKTDAAQEALHYIIHHVEPAARKVFSASDAQTWLTPFWQALLNAAQGRPFDPDAPDIHSAALLLHLSDWDAAQESVAAIPNWRRQPITLAWMAEAQCHLEGLPVVWPYLFELAWIDAPRFYKLACGLPDSRLQRLLQAFEREIEGGNGTPEQRLSAFAWFPAWALIVARDILPLIRGAQGPRTSQPERTCQLLMHLLVLEQQGREEEVIILRKRLRDLHEGLFKLYLGTGESAADASR